MEESSVAACEAKSLFLMLLRQFGIAHILRR
jgi:hypothetical protein